MTKKVINIGPKVATLTKMLSPLGVNANGIHYLASYGVSEEKVLARLAALRAAGVPMVGLPGKILMSKPGFSRLLERYSQNAGLTQRQIDLANFLKTKRVGKKVSQKIVSSMVSLEELKRRFAVLEAIKLDPQQYGVSRIPRSLFSRVLTLPASDIARSLPSRVFDPIRKRFAETELDRIWPEWRKHDFGKLTPITVFERTKAAIASGMKPSHGIVFRFKERTLASNTTAQKRVDLQAILKQIERNPRIEKTEEQANARKAVILELVSKPTLAISKNWLFQRMQQKTGMAISYFGDTLEALTDMGIIKIQNREVRLSLYYRTGTNSAEEHQRKLFGRLTAMSVKGKARRAREIARVA